MNILVLLLVLLYSTFIYAVPKFNPYAPSIMYIWKKSFLISPDFAMHFCTGALIRRNFLISNKMCITRYSRNANPKDFVITAGPEIHSPFYNGVTFNYLREIFDEQQFTGNANPKANRSMFIITTAPFSINRWIQITPLSTKRQPIPSFCPAYIFINRTGIRSVEMITYMAKLISDSSCVGPPCYKTEDHGVKVAKEDIHVDTYLICDGYLVGISPGPYVNGGGINLILICELVDYLFPYLDVFDKAEKVNPVGVVQIMLFLMNAMFYLLF